MDEGGGVCLVVFLLVGDLGSWSPPGLLYYHQPCPCRCKCNTLYGLVGSTTGGPRFFVPGPIQFIAAPSRRSLTVHFDFPLLLSFRTKNSDPCNSQKKNSDPCVFIFPVHMHGKFTILINVLTVRGMVVIKWLSHKRSQQPANGGICSTQWRHPLAAEHLYVRTIPFRRSIRKDMHARTMVRVCHVRLQNVVGGYT